MSGLSGFMLSCIILNCDILYTDVIHSPCKHNKMSYAQTLHGSIFSRVKITSSGIVNSVHQAAPPKSSSAPIPQGATSFLWLLGQTVQDLGDVRFLHLRGVSQRTHEASLGHGLLTLGGFHGNLLCFHCLHCWGHDVRRMGENCQNQMRLEPRFARTLRFIQNPATGRLIDC